MYDLLVCMAGPAVVIALNTSAALGVGSRGCRQIDSALTTTTATKCCKLPSQILGNRKLGMHPLLKNGGDVILLSPDGQALVSLTKRYPHVGNTAVGHHCLVPELCQTSSYYDFSPAAFAEAPSRQSWRRPCCPGDGCTCKRLRRFRAAKSVPGPN